MIRRIQQKLEQPFMGIDLLRCKNGKSYVIDINSVKFDEHFKTTTSIDVDGVSKEVEVHVNEIGVPKAERTE